MRREATQAEARLWRWLRERRFGGYKFRRQVPMCGYILDFYCAPLGLALELDGAHHGMPGMLDYDDERSRRLQTRSIEVLRIPNELLMRDAERAEMWIRLAIEDRAGRK